MAKYIDFPSRKMAFGVAVIAVLAVTVVSALGLMAPITQLVGRAVGSARAAVMGIFGKDRRAAA